MSRATRPGIRKITNQNGTRYEARYRDANGRERSQRFASKGAAEAFLDRTLTQKRSGELIDPTLGRTTFATWARQWRATTVDLRPSTLDVYDLMLRRHLLPTFGDLPLAKITPTLVREWMAALSVGQLSPSSVAKAYRLLARIMTVAVDDGMIPRSPCGAVKPPKEPHHEMLFLRHVDVADLAEAIDPYYRRLVYTAAYTGLRWGELAGLRVHRLDLMHRTVRVEEQLTEVNGTLAFGPPKTDAGLRTVDLPAFLVPMLTEQLKLEPVQTTGLVFPQPDGTPMRRSNFRRRAWTPAVRRALPTHLQGLRFHDLRHTAVALAIAAGAHPREIMERLGHSSITVTIDRYGHLLPGQGRALADRLDAAFAAAQSQPQGEVVTLTSQSQ